jgi:probable phosphoglycerate mutase
MKSTILYIIRHGQTDWNIIGKIQGQIDIPLNDEGKEQAERVASFLKKKNASPHALYSSDLQRAHQTAQPISKTFSLNITATPHLRERHVGILQGLTKQQVSELHGKHWENDFDIVPDGETKAEFLKRITNQIALIAENHIDESVVVVTHGHAIRQFITHAGYDKDEWPPITNASIITVKYHHGDKPQIELISIECAE